MYAELFILCIFEKIFGNIPSLDIATYILLIAGNKARNTEAVAIEDAKTTKNEKSDNIDTSIATSKGVFEFAITPGPTIASANQLTMR